MSYKKIVLLIYSWHENKEGSILSCLSLGLPNLMVLAGKNLDWGFFPKISRYEDFNNDFKNSILSFLSLGLPNLMVFEGKT